MPRETGAGLLPASRDKGVAPGPVKRVLVFYPRFEGIALRTYTTTF